MLCHCSDPLDLGGRWYAGKHHYSSNSEPETELARACQYSLLLRAETDREQTAES